MVRHIFRLRTKQTIQFFRDTWRIMRGRPLSSLGEKCDHDWKETRHFVRECSKCKRSSYLMEKRFPGVDEPKYTWSR